MDFPAMRRSRQLLAEDESKAILAANGTGVLAMTGENGYPYSIPVNYFYTDGKIYIHGANAGHKIRALAKDNRVSFTVIDKEVLVPEKFTTYFRSVIAFGHADIMADKEAALARTAELSRHFCPGESEEHLQKALAEESASLAVLEITIDHITGKECIEWIRERNQ